MEQTSLISKLIDGKFFVEYKKKNELEINQVLLADIVEVANYYKKNFNNFEYFKLVRFFSDDYEDFLLDERFFEYTQDYFPEIKKEEFVSDFNMLYTWYLEKHKDSIIEIESLDNMMQVYQELIKLD